VGLVGAPSFARRRRLPHAVLAARGPWAAHGAGGDGGSVLLVAADGNSDVTLRNTTITLNKDTGAGGVGGAPTNGTKFGGAGGSGGSIVVVNANGDYATATLDVSTSTITDNDTGAGALAGAPGYFYSYSAGSGGSVIAKLA
jgi:hypothetical protein